METRKIILKTNEEIKIMAEGGKKLGRILEEVIKKAKPGVEIRELDCFAEELIKKAGGRPSFKMVPKYKWATCLCVNEVVVHGIPNDYILKEGDILGIDVGMYYKGFHTDTAHTIKIRNSKYEIRNKKEEIDKFLKTGIIALEKAIGVAKVGNYLGHISKAIQETIEGQGYSVVRSLVGHGVGRKLHEEPQIPGFLKGKIKVSAPLKIGMTLAIEVIYNQGGKEVVFKNDDGWTIATADGEPSGLFEHTIAVTENGPIILTQTP